MNQWTKNIDGQNARFRVELVQLARLGVAGDTERLKIQIMRLIRMLRQEGDDLADALQNAAFDSGKPRKTRPTRSAGGSELSLAEPLPMDEENKADLLRAEDPPVLQHPLIHDAGLERQVQQLISERKAMDELARLGLSAPRCVLFTGPPGVGKTETAREIAKSLGLPLLILDLATVISHLLGRTGNNIKHAFAFARRTSCVLFLDEIDAVAKKRDDDTDVGELKRLVTVLLQEIDLWPTHNLLLAATNHAHLLDPAVTRRFDQSIEFSRPSAAQLSVLGRHIVAQHLKFPPGWVDLLAMLLDDTSHSDFVRDLNRLRRALVLGGKQEGSQLLRDITEQRTPLLDKTAKKKVAYGLVKHLGTPQREASRLTGLARDTVKLLIQGGVEDGRPTKVPTRQR